MGNGLCVETSSSWTVFDWLDKVLGNIGSYSGAIKVRNDDDVADRLSHHYTTIILIIFAVVVSTKQYVGDSIQCWCPAQFTEAHVAYTNQVCWVSNTYYIPINHVIPIENAPKEEATLTYYQWVPMILLFMALLFKIPRIIWKVLVSHTALNLDRLVSLVFELQLLKKAERDDKINDITDFLHDWLDIGLKHPVICFTQVKRKVARYSCFVCGRKYGNFFVTAAMCTKIMYFSNAILQFFALNAFLGTDFATWGFQVMTGLAQGDPEYLEKSHRFPRVTLCDFQIRQMMNIQQWTVQCVLPINLFNSRIFLFIWFWLVLLCIASFMTLFFSLYGLLFPEKRFEYIKKHLKIQKLYTNKSQSERRLIKRFVMEYLKFDGVFVLRVMARNGTDILTSQIIGNMYMKYKRRLSDKTERNGTDVDST